MFDAKRLLDQLLGSDAARAGGGQGLDLSRLGGLARDFGGSAGFGGGAALGGLAGVLLGSKHGRKLGGSALKLGGMAVVGALAYKAWQEWQGGAAAPAGAKAPASGAPALEPPGDAAFNPPTEGAQQALGRRLLTAMIAAAKADGHIDAAEQASIFARLDALRLDPDDKAFVLDQLRAPLDVDAVANGARSPEEASEIYVASLLAVDVDNAAERGYLAMLAARLKLDDALVARLHATVEGATEKA